MRPSRHPTSTTRTSIRSTTARTAEPSAADGVAGGAERGTTGQRDQQTRRPVAEEREHGAHVEDLVEAEVARPRVRLLQRVADAPPV
jgi:hypothetical protein